MFLTLDNIDVCSRVVSDYDNCAYVACIRYRTIFFAVPKNRHPLCNGGCAQCMSLIGTSGLIGFIAHDDLHYLVLHKLIKEL